MARPPELRFDFVARYEVEVLDRIDRIGVDRVLGFPGAFEIDSQRAVSDGVVLRVVSERGEVWIGVFELGDYSRPAVARAQVLGWPDERSLCVVHRGVGCVVRTDDPQQHFEIECWPICDVLPITDRKLIVFADWVGLVAYAAEGKLWQTDRLVWDDLRILRAEGDRLIVSGFDPAGAGPSHPEFAVDVESGEAPGRPYP